MHVCAETCTELRLNLPIPRAARLAPSPGMLDFLNPAVTTPHSPFEMGTLGQLSLIALLFVQLGALIAFRRQLPKLRQNRAFMAGTAGFVLGLEVLSYALKLIVPTAPAWEILPFQLCSSLKIVVTILVLLEQYQAIRYFAVLAIGCGFISFANLNMHGESFGNFAFWHYVIGHDYLFVLPIFLYAGGEYRADKLSHSVMCKGLAAWSFTIFLVNWVFDTNYMYTGPHNDVTVPFVPESWMRWPMNYVTYVLIALVMLNVIWGVVMLAQRAQRSSRQAPQPSPESALPSSHSSPNLLSTSPSPQT
jgi:uncharacterized membrane protein YwaF